MDLGRSSTLASSVKPLVDAVRLGIAQSSSASSFVYLMCDDDEEETTTNATTNLGTRGTTNPDQIIATTTTTTPMFKAPRSTIMERRESTNPATDPWRTSHPRVTTTPTSNRETKERPNPRAESRYPVKIITARKNKPSIQVIIGKSTTPRLFHLNPGKRSATSIATIDETTTLKERASSDSGSTMAPEGAKRRRKTPALVIVGARQRSVVPTERKVSLSINPL